MCNGYNLWVEVAVPLREHRALFLGVLPESMGRILRDAHVVVVRCLAGYEIDPPHRDPSVMVTVLRRNLLMHSGDYLGGRSV